ncbi:aquaporin-8a.2 [Pseudorasbora parva]|uniref:aquaporin-8a.2 n=1 Tax=Pseudorasbora parva TaxID=51549 RepID=UPI00351F5B37
MSVEVEKLELKELDKTLLKKNESSTKPLSKYERILQPCVAELVGTMFFVFIGCVSVIENVEAAGRLQPALVHGLAVAVLVACMAEISGSHFNPPFTIAIWLCGGIQLTMVVPYLISQLIGGVLGAAMSKVMTSHKNYMNATGAAFAVLKSDEQLGKVVFAEMAMTCLVTMVVLLGAVNGKSKSPLVPFMVGCTVIINILAGGDVSGTCLNPARAFGPALMANYWSYHWVYWVGPIGGALVAAVLVRLLLGDEKTRVIMK